MGYRLYSYHHIGNTYIKTQQPYSKEEDMSTNQKHHMDYVIKYVQGNVVKEKTIHARLLSDALYTFLKECIETDDTGIFGEVENADYESLKKNRKYHVVCYDNSAYGIILEGLRIENPLRNKYLNELRAKRELLGFNIEEFAYEAGVNAGSYKEKEEGHRKMNLDEYASFMKILDLYEQISR